MGTFGAVIPVTGLNIGFLGQISRTADPPVVAARQAKSTNLLNINFGDACVLLSDALGGTWQSVADYIIGAGTPSAPTGPAFNPANFAGVAVREVKTNLGYPITPGNAPTGYYAAGQMAEVMERGSITVLLKVTTGIGAGKPVFIRVALNGAIPAGVIGGFEAQADVAASTTGTAAAIGTALTAASGTGTANGQYVSGFGIPDGTYVASGGGTTSIVLSQSTTAIIAAGTPVTFSNTVQLPSTVFRTGVADANNVAEITLLSRQAA